MDKRDSCNYRKASQFREVADIAYVTIYISDSNYTQRFGLHRSFWGKHIEVHNGGLNI